MLAVKITELKNFMTELLAGRSFDEFSLGEGSVTTFCTMSLNGARQEAFYRDQNENKKEPDDPASPNPSGHKKKASLVRWKQVKPYFFNFIRGRHMPLRFHFVFYYPEEQTKPYLLSHGFRPGEEDQIRLCLNLKFSGGTLLLTTGVFHSAFSLDRRCEQIWDDGVRDFLASRKISFEEA